MSYLSDGVSALVTVDRRLDVPLHRQVYERFRAAILSGKLRPGQMVPSSRELASDQAISRFPVLHAYAQLIAEGYFETRAGAGTYIASNLPERLMNVSAATQPKHNGAAGPRNVSHRIQALPGGRLASRQPDLGSVSSASARI